MSGIGQRLNPRKCHKCGGRGEVYKGESCVGYQWRRHKCQSCGTRWTSYQSRFSPVRLIRRIMREEAKLAASK